MEDLYKLALEVAKKAHNNQLDKGGNPYINHPIAVAKGVTTIKQKIIALLHDVCEDSEITFNDLMIMGFPEDIIASLKVITKNKDMPYQQYLTNLKNNHDARIVKIADIKHNMDLSRIPNPTSIDFKRRENYQEALNFLLDD